MAQNSGAPRSQEDYITQVSEEIEGRVTKRLSKEFSRTGNRILGALARLDDFLMNPLLPGHSGAAPAPTRYTTRNNQGTNEDGSQTDPHPEASLFHGQREQNSGTRNDYDTDQPGNKPLEANAIVAVYPRSLRALRKKRTSPDCLKFRRNFINTSDFSISIHITIMQ